MKKPDDYISQTIYEGAPQLLMNRIHEVEALLANSKIKNGENDSYKFWKRTADVMKFAWNWMEDLAWVIKENYQLKQENQFLRNWNLELMTRCRSYETVKMLITGEKFDEVLAVAERHLALRLEEQQKLEGRENAG